MLFSSPKVDKLYNVTLDACALRPDLEQLPSGDQTEIGEKVLLSSCNHGRVKLPVSPFCYHFVLCGKNITR